MIIMNAITDESYCGTGPPLDSGGPEAVDEIALDSLKPSDRLLIQTANSAYSFVVIDPRERRGVLIGGASNECHPITFLVGARGRKNAETESDPSGLRTGAPAIFVIESGNRLRSLVTSIITGLIHIKAH